jgi:hypothetical protein
MRYHNLIHEPQFPFPGETNWVKRNRIQQKNLLHISRLTKDLVDLILDSRMFITV